jgi:hypothetical protein
MLNKYILANTLAITSGLIWVACSAFVLLFPGLTNGIISWWLHGADVSLLGSRTITAGGFTIGLISFVLLGWVVGFVFGWIYQIQAATKRA